MSEWQPIETAPRDGTIILAWVPQWTHFRPAYYVLMRWEIDARSFRGGWSIQLPVGTMPAHWMPLPAPPADDRGETC